MYIKIYFILLLLFSSLSAQELKKVKLQLSWFDQFQFAGYYIAKEKGFYQEAGLDVEIIPFEFGLDIPKDVSDGKIDFAVGRETLILERANNRNIVSLYALFQSTPLVLLSTKESKINSINDFKNKRVMTTIDDSSEVSLKAMISSHNLKMDDMRFLRHTHNIMDLVDKKTDVISAYISKTPYDLTKMGIEYNIYDPKKYGFDMYSDFLFTSHNLILNDIKTVLEFKKASLRGWQYAFSNIQESADLIIDKYNVQKLSKEALQYEAIELKKLAYFETKELGEIKRDKIQRIYDLYNVMGLVPKRIELDDFVYYDEKFENLNFTEEEQKYIENKKSVSMCIIPDFMPYSAVKDGKLNGFISDYIKLLETKTNLSFSLVKTDNWEQSLLYAKNKKCEMISSAAITDDRKSYLSFTRDYFTIPFVVVTKNNISFFDNLGTLKDKKISVVKDYANVESLKKRYPNIIFEEVANINVGLNKVKDAQVYGHIDAIATSWYNLQTKYFADLKISAKLDNPLDLRIAVNKDDQLLLSILDKAIGTIDVDKKNTLLNKWISVEVDDSFDYKLLWEILIAIMVIILAIVYKQKLLHDNNKLLQKMVDEKTKELKEINKNLEDRIKEAVEENLNKDRIMHRQARMAAMGEMIQNIAHQWRQPLSIITTGASGLKIQKEMMGEIEEKFLLNTLDSIVDTSKHLSSTIDDFMNYFKPNKAKYQFEVVGAVQKAIKLLTSRFTNKDIEIIENYQAVLIESYEGEFIQVVINILNNAKDVLMLLENDEKLIFIDINKDDKSVIVKIKDNGGGIDQKIIEKIFEPYFTTKHQFQGTGIGLFMCEEIITKHINGQIEVKNVEYIYNNKQYIGAEFTLTLPLI